MKTLLIAASLFTVVSCPASVRAADTDADSGKAQQATTSVRDQVPKAAYTYGAFGSESPSVGAAALAVSRGSFKAGDNAWLGGGVRAWGSPFKRLTIIAEGQRRDDGRFAPLLGGQVRLVGDRTTAFAVAVMGQYVAEGFAQLDGEVEGGLAVSFKKRSLHLDANAIFGGSFEGEEADGELLARCGYDVAVPVRLGAEFRIRQRLAGIEKLPGGRDWDAFAGAQAMLELKPVFFALTAGPSTVGIADGIGWSALATFGGMSL